MTPTNEITDPTWEHILERDKYIKELEDRLKRLRDLYEACKEQNQALKGRQYGK